jgi:hypothetical protein
MTTISNFAAYKFNRLEAWFPSFPYEPFRKNIYGSKERKTVISVLEVYKSYPLL